MFSDITNHWASECITLLANRDIIGGYPNGTFRPQRILTRAEFAALMTRAFAQLPILREATLFRDVSPTYWASQAIDWATQRGLFSGYGDGSFRPQLEISRLQALLVLVAGMRPEKDGSPSADPTLLTQQLSDAAEIPAWAQATVTTALDWQLLEQFSSPRSLLPNQPITRGEAAALLCRALSIPTENLIRDYPALTQAENRQAVFDQFLRQEAGFNAAKLAFLDKGIAKSPYIGDLPQYASRLKTGGQRPGVIPGSVPKAVPYPNRGSLPPIDANGLDFLSADTIAGCVCLSTIEDQQVYARWLGRLALNNRQMWSATKFVPLLNVIDQANAISPNTPIDNCRVRKSSADLGYAFSSLATGVVNYDNRIATSNALAVMFKNFATPTGLEGWMRKLTGNTKLSFRGRYGELPFIQFPELWDTKNKQVLLKAAGVDHRGDNLVSPYDLTRLITMAAWHYQLSNQADLPAAMGHSLKPFILAMGNDTARYVDAAIDTLGLRPYLQSPVIISKSGFGRSDQRDRTELTYSALVHLSLPRQGAADPTAAYQQYALSFTLIVTKQTGDGNEEARYVDARMAADVTEILRRAVTNAL